MECPTYFSCSSPNINQAYWMMFDLWLSQVDEQRFKTLLCWSICSFADQCSCHMSVCAPVQISSRNMIQEYLKIQYQQLPLTYQGEGNSTKPIYMYLNLCAKSINLKFICSFHRQTILIFHVTLELILIQMKPQFCVRHYE